MDTQAIFFDIDGTLSRDGVIHPNNLDTLYELHEQGIRLVIATGRGIAMLPDDILELFNQGVFDALICMNGQYNCTRDGIISHYPLSQRDSNTIIEICNKYDLLYKLDSVEHIAWPRTNIYYETMCDKYRNFIIDEDYHNHTPIYQCSIIIDEDPEHHDIIQSFTEQGLQFTRWQKKGADVLPINASKARGIDDTCKHFGIARDNTMAFGDGLNDIEMLEHVNIGVAMGDSWPALMECADYITTTIEEDGIRSALHHFSILPA